MLFNISVRFAPYSYKKYNIFIVLNLRVTPKNECLKSTLDLSGIIVLTE